MSNLQFGEQVSCICLPNLKLGEQVLAAAMSDLSLGENGERRPRVLEEDFCEEAC